MTEPRVDTRSYRTVYRVQASDGRGPWRPGFSATWADRFTSLERELRCRPIFTEPGYEAALTARPLAWPVACAVPTLSTLAQWFSRREAKKLRGLGYRIVRFDDVRILGWWPTQLLVARAAPFSEGGQVVPWENLRWERAA